MSAAPVDVVVVSYNVKELLLQCLASLQVARDRGTISRLIVVDNDSRDGSADAVERQLPQVKLIRSHNGGYGAGANRGIAEADAPYVLILNPDTVLPTEAIERMSAFLDEHPDVGLAGPRLRYPDGSIQSSRRRFPRRLTPVFESTIFERWLPDNPWARHYRMFDAPEGDVRHVDWLVGACLMVRRDAVTRVGAFDESFWMYCEEIEWCWRMRRHGWKVAYLPDAEITHHEGASSSQDIYRRQLAFDRSRVELQRRLYGVLTARVCAGGIVAGYALQASIELAKLTLGHRRDLRRQRFRQYARLVRAGVSAPPVPVRP